jgi:AcrR family transcriptional regulator
VVAVRASRVRRGSAPGLLRDAAREVFAERGYRATTREIADRAGVSHDLIFRYFESKERLFSEAVGTPLLDAVDGLHRQWLDDPAVQSLEPKELVRRFTVAFYRFMSENQPIARAMVHLFTEGPTEGELATLRSRVNDTLVSMLPAVDTVLSSEGIRRTSPALQLRIMLLLVGAIATFLPKTYPTDDDVPPTAAVIDELAEFIYCGLRAT